MEASSNHLGTAQHKWDHANPVFKGYLLLAYAAAMVNNLGDLCRSMNEKHRYFNKFLAFSRRGIRELE